MKAKIIFVLFLTLFAGIKQLDAQCVFNNFFNSSITLNGGLVTTVSCVQGGQYVAVPVVAGETYSFTTCNSVNGGDSQITLFNSSNTSTSIGYNDDDCGLFSTVTYTATFTGDVYVQVSEYNCVSSTTCYTLDVQCTTCAALAGCSYTIDLFDSWGDGWDGSSVDVLINGVTTYSYTVTGSSSSYSFSVNACDVVTLSFIDGGGLYNNEVSFDLYEDPNLITPIYSADYSGGTVLLGDVFSTTCGGAACGGGALPNTDCSNMAPICTSTGINFTIEASGVDANTAYPGPNYDCLGTAQFGSAPDPTFWYLQISQAGAINMSLSAPADIDYIIWGPFTDLSAAQASCGNMGNAPTATNGAVVDCSYSFTNNELPSIPSAQVGEVYVMMITNYAGAQQQVSLTQTGGTGATDCSIVSCGADVGTFTLTQNGSPATSPLVLCDTDCFSITSNNDYVLPTPVVGEVSELMYAIYTCAPGSSQDPDLDPCYSGLLWTGEDFSDCNSAAGILQGAGLGPVVYFVPITMDDSDNNGDPNGVINWDNNGDGCWDLGTPIEIAFLTNISWSGTMDPCTGVATITINGGMPAYDGSNYTITNTGSGTLSGTPISNGGSVTLSGLTNGQTVSLNVTDGNGCTVVVTYGPVSVTATANAGSDGSTSVCANGSSINLFDYLGGVPDNIGTWSGGLTGGYLGTYDPNTFSPGVYTYSVNPGSGCPIVTANVTVTETPLPTATIGTTITVCQNAGDQTITFTGATGTAPYTFTYTVNGGSAQTITSDGTGVATVLQSSATVGTYTYNLVSVEDANLCSQSQTGTAVVTVNPLPTATISGTAEVCQGSADQTITLTGANGTAPYTFTYTVNGGATQSVTSDATGVATVTQSASVSGIFLFDIVDVTDASSSACSQLQTGTVTVTVNPLPTAAISGTVTVCEGAGDQTITLTGSNGTAPYTFSYTMNGGGVQTITSDATGVATVTQSSATVGTYTFDLVDVTDASATACSQLQTGSVTITVDALPVLTLQDTTDCSPFTVDLSDAMYWSTDVGTMTWYSDAGLTSPLASTTVGAGTYYVEADNAGCTSSGSVLVTEVTTPNVDPLGPIAECDSYTLPVITGTALSGTEAYYTGMAGTGTAYNAGDAITTAGLTTLYIYDGASGCSDEEVLDITITITPTITATDPAAVCEPNTVDISGSATADVGTLTWYSDAGLTTPVADPTQVSTGTFYVEADNNGCTSSDMVNVTINPMPPAPQAGTDSTYCSGWTLENMTATGTGGTLNWYLDTTSSSIGTGGTYNPNSTIGSTIYYVSETLAGCEGPANMVTITTQSCDIFIPTAITPNGDLNNDEWEIVDLDNAYPNNTVRVFNRWGNLIFEHISDNGASPYSNNKWDGTYEGSALPVGSYYYVIELNDEDGKIASGAVSIVLE